MAPDQADPQVVAGRSAATQQSPRGPSAPHHPRGASTVKVSLRPHRRGRGEGGAAGSAPRNASTTTVPTPAPASALIEPVKLRRRPGYLAAGVLSIAVGALLAVWLFTSSGKAHSVLAVRQPVARGEMITAAALTSVAISTDPALKVVPSSALSDVVGRRATVDLAAGGLVTQGSYSDQVIPAPGNSLVGVWLAPGQLPGQTLQAGDPIRVVLTPKPSEDPQQRAPDAVRAEVVAVTNSDDGHTLVTVSVPMNAAVRLSALVATGRIALVLDSDAK